MSNDTAIRDRKWAGLEITLLGGQKGEKKARYPIEVFVNVTNQPIFGDGLSCDRQVRLFNTSLSQGRRAVRGEVYGDLEPLGEVGEEWKGDG